ncbi:maleylpyruvate isomerase family mycothiol-dependent enzyme [Candidatus Frankia alpina]|uniref:maleylpyruvate isomerase family mycothiol-dependent enzyme n=1 Tax=Candidatus Frankia alpina TaxID=2699483 RepID=UPI0013D41086|nr:maleylpyruvate isomerase family mycothiol-dependent enzyme [Candidatus Frankia alpina]
MDHLAVIEAEGLALLATTSAHLDSPVPTCPGWSSRRLLRHVGRLLHSVSVVVPRGTTDPPPPNPPAPTDDEGLVAYYRRALDDLLRALRQTDPAAAAWNHTGVAPPVAGFWHRRLAQELTVHRWDADNAIGAAHLPTAEVAADGVDELLTVLLPGNRAHASTGLADGGVHVHLTDVEGEWLVALAGNDVTVTREHAKRDAALRGPAPTVLLALWGRLPFEHPDLAAFGDEALLAVLHPGV